MNVPPGNGAFAGCVDAARLKLRGVPRGVRAIGACGGIEEINLGTTGAAEQQHLAGYRIEGEAAFR